MKSKGSKEFKEDALRLAEREGVQAASEKLGIRKRQIYDWRREKRLGVIKKPKGIREEESLEVYCQRLEKECAELAEANSILQKAMGFLVGR